MKNIILSLSLLATTLTLSSLSAQVTITQISFSDATTGNLAIGSSTWNRSRGHNAASSISDLKTPSGVNTGISLTVSDLFEFSSSNRGESGTTTSGTTTDGLSTYNSSGVTFTDGNKFFPWAVIESYSAVHAGSDGLAILTFASTQQLYYSFWVVASFDHNNPSETSNWNGLYNVGGTYTLTERAFTGGTTLALNGTKQQGPDDTPDSNGDTTLKFEIGRLTTGTWGFQSVWNPATELYELHFQIGDASTSTDAGALLNGLIVETVIPEPSTYAAIFGLLALGFVAWRRRRTA